MKTLPRSLWAIFVASTSLNAVATPDLKFAVATFCCHCEPDKTFCQAQFDHLN